MRKWVQSNFEVNSVWNNIYIFMSKLCHQANKNICTIISRLQKIFPGIVQVKVAANEILRGIVHETDETDESQHIYVSTTGMSPSKHRIISELAEHRNCSLELHMWRRVQMRCWGEQCMKQKSINNIYIKAMSPGKSRWVFWCQWPIQPWRTTKMWTTLSN